MSADQANTIFSTGGAALYDWSCAGGDTGHVEETKPEFEIVFIRRGVFAAVSRGDEVVLTANEAWLHPPNVPYRIRHPRGGDECTVVSIDRGLLADYAISNRRTAAPVTSAMFAAHHAMRLKGRRGHLTALEFEETVRGLMATMVDPAVPPLSERHRRIALRAQEFLAAHPEENLSLTDVARAVGSSAHHLCRVFRRATGESLHRYQLSLRLRAALARLHDGERDLTALALDFGFADHSHFTNAFRRAFGYPPSHARPLRRST